MLLNRLLRRRGHFWERRYHAVAVPDRDGHHALRVLRYIHANPKAAGMIEGYACAYSNWRSYTRPADDGLSAWHPAYLRLGSTLYGCARRYEQFCRRCRPDAKQQRRSRWGGWRLWREIEGGAAAAGGQADLFGASGARHRGGGPGAKQARPWRCCGLACCARSSPSCGLTPRRAGLLPDLGAAVDARRKDAQTAFGRGATVAMMSHRWL